MKKFIVIEGDNGTGKDTLAQQIGNIGYNIITYTEEAKKAEIKARSSYGEDRLLSFLDYNKTCGLLSTLSNTSSLVIRYWISTLAAAYADQLWDFETVNTKTSYCLSQLPIPDLVIQLKCDFSERKNRVITRGVSDDNMCFDRNERYDFVLNKISSNVSSWEIIDTTHLSQQQVFQIVQEILNK
jgi:thymidylate kinase